MKSDRDFVELLTLTQQHGQEAVEMAIPEFTKVNLPFLTEPSNSPLEGEGPLLPFFMI